MTIFQSSRYKIRNTFLVKNIFFPLKLIFCERKKFILNTRKEASVSDFISRKIRKEKKQKQIDTDQELRKVKHI
jgi:hypothetical protein